MAKTEEINIQDAGSIIGSHNLDIQCFWDRSKEKLLEEKYQKKALESWKVIFGKNRDNFNSQHYSLKIGKRNFKIELENVDYFDNPNMRIACKEQISPNLLTRGNKYYMLQGGSIYHQKDDGSALMGAYDIKISERLAVGRILEKCAKIEKRRRVFSLFRK